MSDQNRNQRPSIEEMQSWPPVLLDLEVAMLCDSLVPLVAQGAMSLLNQPVTPQDIDQLWELQEQAIV